MALIPAPDSIEIGRGHLLLDRRTRIAVERAQDEAVAELARRGPAIADRVAVPGRRQGSPSRATSFWRSDDTIDPEGYILDVDASQCHHPRV